MLPSFPGRLAGPVLAITLAGPGPVIAGETPVNDELPTVVVTASADASAQGVQPAYAGGQVARGGRVGIFGSMDIMKTPFSTTNYTQELIANQQAASVADVLQNDSAVRVARGFGNFQQVYIVRGLPVYSDDMSYNGLYGLLPRQYLAAELVERVEVLNGASGFLNGAAPGGSGLGGAVNVSPKRAPNNAVNDFTFGMESGSQKYLAADVARRYGAEENFGVRFNVVRRDGGTAVDGESRSLTALGVGLDFHMSGLRVSGDVGYQNHQLDASQPSITPLAGVAIPAAPDASTDISQPWAHSDERDVFGTLRMEYDINSLLTVWIAGGLRDGRETDTFANPTLVDNTGDLNIYRFDNARRDLVDTGEVGIRAHFAAGGITQQWILSAAGVSAEFQECLCAVEPGWVLGQSVRAVSRSGTARECLHGRRPDAPVAHRAHQDLERRAGGPAGGFSTIISCSRSAAATRRSKASITITARVI